MNETSRVQRTGEEIDRLSHRCRWLLDLLARHDQQITFFVTGELNEIVPGLIAEIHAAGHEIGYHGHDHRRILDDEVLERELVRSRAFLETYKPDGFRAPWIDLPASCIDVLTAHGFRYDSSAFGGPGVIEQRGGLSIVPVTSLRYSGDSSARYGTRLVPATLLRELPVGAGLICSYLRSVYPRLLDRIARRGACVFYLHLWQFYGDPERRFRGLRRVHKLSMADWLERLLAGGVRLEKTGDLARGKLPTGHHCLSIDLEF